MRGIIIEETVFAYVAPTGEPLLLTRCFYPVNPFKTGGMKTTSTIAAELPSSTANIKKPKKKGGNRKIKIQNTHLKELGIDLSKDFLKPGTPSSSAGKK